MRSCFSQIHSTRNTKGSMRLAEAKGVSSDFPLFSITGFADATHYNVSLQQTCQCGPALQNVTEILWQNVGPGQIRNSRPFQNKLLHTAD